MKTATAGSVAIPIYACRWKRKKTKRVYIKHAITWRDATGKRHREQHASLAVAQARALDIATKIANGQTSMLAMTQADRGELLHCRRKAQEIDLDLLSIVEAATEALKILDARFAGALAEAARFLKAHQGKPVQQKACPEIFADMLAARQKDGLSPNTIADLKSRVGAFARAFPVCLMQVAAADIAAWLRGLKVSRRTRNNYHDAVREFYRFAHEANYAPRTWKPLDQVPKVKSEPVRIEIFTAEEAAKLLGAAKRREERNPRNLRIVPYLAVALFQGCRHEELSNGDGSPVLEWQQVDFDKNEIHVLPEVARKIGRDRLPPMQPNLRAWLLPYRKPSGPICELSNVTNALAEIASDAGVEWKTNGPRRSFISYRLAITKNIGTVAEEAGTSPERIRHNYKKTVPEREAKRYFNVWPTNSEILQLPLEFGSVAAPKRSPNLSVATLAL